jgi:hypothetical protein
LLDPEPALAELEARADGNQAAVLVVLFPGRFAVVERTPAGRQELIELMLDGGEPAGVFVVTPSFDMIMHRFPESAEDERVEQRLITIMAELRASLMGDPGLQLPPIRTSGDLPPDASV